MPQNGPGPMPAFQHLHPGQRAAHGGNCACAASSQAAADPAMTLMKSRRRIASPKAWDHFDLAFNTAITAGIRERQNSDWVRTAMFGSYQLSTRQILLSKEGIRVIDITHVLAGPFAAYQFAVLGADVIKIEHPDDPDQSRGSGTDWRKIAIS